MRINDFISFKKECEMIVMESDLTSVLAVLNENECGNVCVEIHSKPDIIDDNTSWRVYFRTTLEHWTHVYAEAIRVSEHKILIPLKDVFGNVSFHEV